MNNNWIFQQKKRKHPECRVFFFHHAGGTAQVYKDWDLGLSEIVEPCFVQLPMRANRMGDEMPSSIEELAEAFIRDSEELFDLPCMFFGHSMGAKIAYEVSVQLSRKGNNPSALFVSACEAPCGSSEILPYASALQADEEVILDILRDYDHMLEEEVLEDRDFLEYYLPIVRKDFYLSDVYRKAPEEKLRCDLEVFAGIDDAHVILTECSLWKNYTEKECVIYELPGNHFYFESRENRRFVCDRINEKAEALQKLPVEV